MGRLARALALLIICIIICSGGPALGAVVYVKWDSPTNGPGNDWAHAYHTVAAGITASASGGEIWVAGDAAHPYVERITLKAGVGLYGGFAGTETSRSQRNAKTSVTILDGNQGGSVVTCPSGATATTVIDGFTITNGTGTYWSTVSGNCGGGVYCSASSPTISNNNITRNYAAVNGGGVFCSGSTDTPLILGNIITANIGNNQGSAIWSSCTATIANNVVSANIGSNAVYLYSSDTLANNTITGNSGNGVYGTGASSYNNIVAFNSSGFSVGGSKLKNNCVYNPGGSNYGYNGTPGTGDIQVDPKLTSVQYGQIHLRPDSPCRNAGCTTTLQTDIDGQARNDGSGVDIGADESYGETWTFAPVTIRVKPSGNDTNDGSSWALAKRTVQAAITAASSQIGDVWVASGTYSERITLWPYVSLYGGFAGTESSLADRNWLLNATVLDGGAAGSVITARTANSITASRIDGFTIRNGKAATGGGIYCRQSSPTICNNTVTSNTASSYDGGGIYCSGSNVYNNIIMANTAVGNGGGIYAGGSASIWGNSIRGNSAAYGGGLACMYSQMTVSGNTFTANTAGSGGGVYLYQSTDVFSSNLVTGNTATAKGGGVYCMYTGPTVTNNTVAANSAPAGKGGGLCIDGGCNPKVCNNILAFNSSGVYMVSGTPTLKKNCVYNPSSTDYSGLTAGATDFSLDPLFVNTASSDYHIRVTSPCVDTGDSSYVTQGAVDIDGEARIANGTVDIGADEGQARWKSGSAKSTATDGQLMYLYWPGKLTTTASFPDQGIFYVESSDRSFGIQCRATSVPSVGANGFVHGVMATIGGERVLTGAEIVPYSLAVAAVPAPLQLTNGDLGGGAFGLQGGVCGWITTSSERKWGQLTGLNNIGLLVKTCGQVVGFEPVTPPALPTWFKIDDGSGNVVKCLVPSGVTINTGWTNVVVTGISSCEQVGSELHSLLRVRTQSDVVSY